MAKTSLGTLDAAFIDAQRAPGALSKSLPMYHHLRATLFERASRFEPAIASYGEALRIDPQQAESTVNLAPLLGLVVRDSEGLTRLDAVIRDHPRAEGALRNRALLRLKAGNANGFAADLQAAQAIFPRAANAAALAQYWTNRGMGDLGRAWGDEVGRLEPGR